MEDLAGGPFSRVRFAPLRVGAFARRGPRSGRDHRHRDARRACRRQGHRRLSRAGRAGLSLLGMTLACFGMRAGGRPAGITRRSALAPWRRGDARLYALDALARVNPGLDGWATNLAVPPGGPHHLRSPRGHFAGAATLALYGIAIVLIALSAARLPASGPAGLAAPATGRETAGGAVGLHRPPVADPGAANPLGSSGSARRVGDREHRGAAFIVLHRTQHRQAPAIGRRLQELLRGGRDQLSGDRRVVTSVWLSIAAVIVAAYAITQTSHWRARTPEEVGDGDRPTHRALAGRCRARPSPSWWGPWSWPPVGSVVTGAVAPSQGVHLNTGGLVTATALLALLALTFGAVGALFISRLPRVAVSRGWRWSPWAVSTSPFSRRSSRGQAGPWISPSSPLWHAAHHRGVLDRAVGDGRDRGGGLRWRHGGDAGSRGRPLT